jgi:hypothetical protein
MYYNGALVYTVADIIVNSTCFELLLQSRWQVSVWHDVSTAGPPSHAKGTLPCTMGDNNA